MNINITCQLSISKKLRNLIGNSETNLTLVSDTLKDGRGLAKITLQLESLKQSEIDELLNKETSIMFTPTNFGEENDFSSSVSSIFSDNVNTNNQRTPADKIAAITPPQKMTDNRYAIKTQEEINQQAPKPFAPVNQPSYKKYITDLNQFLEAVKASENKTYSGDIDSIQDPRKRALALEEKERAEAIDYPAFIINEKYATLTINDIGINLMLNMPFNLANVSAKRLANSTDLKALLRQGMIKFISPEEVNNYLGKAEDVLKNPGLEVFSGRKQAEAAFASKESVEEVQIGNEDLMAPTEQEQLATTLIRKAPASNTMENGVRRSVHGSNAPRIPKTVPTESSPSNQNKPQLKTIRRTGIEYR